MTQHLYAQFLDEAAASDERLVTVDRRGDRAVVTMADPGRLNVLSAALTIQTKEALTELVADGELRSIVLTGADPGFSAGGDLRMMVATQERLADPPGTTDIWRWIRHEFGAVARLIARSDKAFIAAINGPAAGVALAWALTCDIALASEKALIVPAFGRIGLLPEVGTSWALVRALGYQGAFAFFAGGEHLTAERARELGLVQEVVPHDELLVAADAWCDRIASLPPHALEMGKTLLRQSADATWDASLTLEEFAEPNCFTTGAFQQATRDLLRPGPQRRPERDDGRPKQRRAGG